MDLNNQRVLVVGLGRSGVASALFLQGRGARVTVSDAKPLAELGDEIPFLLDHGITVETGGHGERTFQGQDLIVVSPGVPLDALPLVQARQLGVPVIGEIELAAEHFPGPIVAITGSNGKTTTTTLVGEILGAAGFSTRVGGNIGTPAIALVEDATAETVAVLEVSSFQLESIQRFRPRVAVILNITPDHLDRHRSFEAYVAAKARIFENQEGDDFTVLNANDAACVSLGARTRGQLFWFGRETADGPPDVRQGAFSEHGQLRLRRLEGEREVMAVSEIPLKGQHNVENVLAAALVATLMGCTPEQIRGSVRAFRAVEHRLEYVATIEGVEYYNDSKATNVDATIKALESFPANIHLILGGKDKGSDYTVLAELLRSRVKCVYTIGASASKIESEIGEACPTLACGTLERAVESAARRAQAGDIVLLAPACASFDQFKDYQERGRRFKKVVEGLSKASSSSSLRA